MMNGNEYGFDKEYIEMAARCLRKNGFTDIARLFSDMAQDKDCLSVELINSHHYFAKQLWSREDLVNILESHDVPATDENIEEMYRHIHINIIEDCTPIWEYLEHVFETTFNK